MNKPLSKQERIELRKKEIGSRHKRNLESYSDDFNEKFEFFFNIVRKDLLTFCGSETIVISDSDGDSAKFKFRQYESGKISNAPYIKCKHSNILETVIRGKKAWGLWCAEYSLGIADGLFKKEEILREFEKRNITIPKSFLKKFENSIHNEKMKIYDKILNHK
jgi:hypothetical protein